MKIDLIVHDTTPHQKPCIGIGLMKDEPIHDNDSDLISAIFDPVSII